MPVRWFYDGREIEPPAFARRLMGPAAEWDGTVMVDEVVVDLSEILLYGEDEALRLAVAQLVIDSERGTDHG